MLLFAVWLVWVYTTWFTNWLDPQHTSVRLMLFALMLVGLVLSSSIPGAFEKAGLTFACAYVAMQVGRNLFMLWSLNEHSPGNFRNFQRITTWFAASGVLWIAGGLTDDGLLRARALDRRAYRRIRRGVDRVCGSRPWPLQDGRLGHRGKPHG